MQTHFAPVERASPAELQRAIEAATANPVISALLQTASGLLAVLNEYRQVLAVNEAFLQMLGVKDAAETLGLRPGEVIKCVHAHDMPGGCGTSRFCSTCGAAIAIVTALNGGKADERKCAATVEQNGKQREICFRVRACPVTYDGRPLILLFLQDITIPQQWAAIERTFFHDINNIIGGLSATAELMALENDTGIRDLGQRIRQMTSRLADEVRIQRALAQEEFSEYQPMLRQVSTRQIVDELRNLFAHHPVAQGKTLRVPPESADVIFSTDPSLLLRILTNMLVNAFEATDEKSEVRLWVEQQDKGVRFCVWNQRAIPEDVARRIFQRHYSTKDEPGRGFGTYAMKLFGERFLGGTVDFASSERDGTVFRFSPPA